MNLFPFQKIGADWLSRRRFALLADEPGLGKSAQSVVAAQNLNSVLVACPAVAQENWRREFKKFDETRTNPPEIASYDYIIRHLKDFTKTRWDALIGDEWHYLKEPTSQRTRAMLGKEGLIHAARKTWALSGTPAPNHAGELWPTLFTFGETKLSYDKFIERYCHAYKLDRFDRLKIVGTNKTHIHEVRAALKRISLRRLQTEVLKDLPQIFHSLYYIQSDEDPLVKFPELKEKLTLELERLSKVFQIEFSDKNILETLSVLAPSISTLRRYHGLKKMSPTVELIKGELDVDLYDKVVVFGIHKDVIEFMKGKFQYYGFNPAVVTGQTPKADRQKEIDRFQNDKNCKVFLGNIKAAGVAITLTAANQVVFVEEEWTPADNIQAAKRCHRITQTRPVFVRHMTLANSLDEKINGVLNRKTEEISSFIVPSSSNT